MTLLTKAKLKELQEFGLPSDIIKRYKQFQEILEILEKTLALVEAAKKVAKSYKAITVIGSPIFHLKEALAPFLEEWK